MSIQTPRFIDQLERKYHRFGIENLGIYLVVIQAFGFLAISMQPMVAYKFILLPDLLLKGEAWRIFTFLAMPLAFKFWIVFALLFLYMVMQALEQTWGSFKITLYVFLGWLFSVAYSVATGMPIVSFMHMQMSLLFAIATVFPEMEIYLFGLIPIRMWMLGLFYVIVTIMEFVAAPPLMRGYYAVVFANYFIFFGVHHLEQIRRLTRRRGW